jgi:hypothetical protein
MKLLSVTLGLFSAVAVIQTAKALKCESGCSACWKDNNAYGVDVKIPCEAANDWLCDTPCPDGFHDQHCAKASRCK